MLLRYRVIASRNLENFLYFYRQREKTKFAAKLGNKFFLACGQVFPRQSAEISLLDKR